MDSPELVSKDGNCVMISRWVEEEMETVDLQHKRRNTRAKQLVSDLAAMPAASIPAAVGGGRAETEAAYRFFDNPNVEFDAILAPHRDSTLKRIEQYETVIIAQDSSELDLTRPEEQVEGAGPLDSGSRRGCFIHPLLALTPEGVPLGTLSTECWTRDEPAPVKPDKAQRKREQKQTPIEDKESLRWVTGLKETHKIAALVPGTKVIGVADSEADIYELIVAGQNSEDEGAPRADWLVRASQDRALRRNAAEADTARSILEAVTATSVLTTYEVAVRGREPKVGCETRGRRQARESRQALVEVRACIVTLRGPYRPDRKLPDVTVNVVFVQEINPPAGEEPISWLLLTSLPISTTAEVLSVIQTYCQRWSIEVFFRVLKQGCRIEWRRFEKQERVERFLAIALIVSWRTLYVTRLGRECPDLNCEAVFEVSEWKSVYQVTQKKTPPKTPPKLQEFVRMVAQLGGYVNRPRADEPGAETIWKGLQRTYDIANCWELFGPGKK
jgi:hypothetical protein